MGQVIVGCALPAHLPTQPSPTHREHYLSVSSPNPQWPDYRRAYIPGGAIFLTLVIFNRRPIFAEADKFEVGWLVGE